MLPETELHNRQLKALSDALLVVASNLSLADTLRHIVSTAAHMVDARYGALGIPDEQGEWLIEFVTTGMSADEEARIPHRPHGKGILGVVMREGQSLRLADLAQHPRSAGFPANHPPMHSFLGVPIRYKDRLWGLIYLTEKTTAPDFSVADQALIEMLAVHAGLAIEHAHLYEQVQQVRVLEERQRIGMDLHDGVIQSIYAVGLNLELINALLSDGHTDEASRRVRDAIEALNTTIRDIRNYILDLRPRRFEGDNLAAGLHRLLTEFRANTLLAVDFRHDENAERYLSVEARLAFFHIAQETLSNAARHSRASRVDIRLGIHNEAIQLVIRDNGRGFNMQAAERRIGHGLLNMVERARAVGGDLTLHSQPDHGTEVRVELPLARATKLSNRVPQETPTGRM